jgi:hypothetical protein
MPNSVRDARARLFLKRPLPQHALEEGAVADDRRARRRGRQRCLPLPLQDGFPVLDQAQVQNHGRRNQRPVGTFAQQARRTEFHLELSRVGHGGIGAVERPVCLRVMRPGHHDRQHRNGGGGPLGCPRAFGEAAHVCRVRRLLQWVDHDPVEVRDAVRLRP